MRRFCILNVIILLLLGCGAETAVPPTTIPPTSVAQNPTSTEEVLIETQSPPATPTLHPTQPATKTSTPIPNTPIPNTPIPNTATPSPTPIPTTAPLIELPGAIVPRGFSLIKYADLYRPTSLTFDANGRLFATSFDGTVHVFTDLDGDGRSDQDDVFASGFDIPLGVVARDQPRDILISSNGKITVLRDLDGDNSAESRFDLVTGLPTGLHQNNNLKLGPDGWLYMGVGSTCDVCDEPDSRSATIMRFDPNTGAGEIVASGLRNPYDLAWHPLTNDLFATENGRDDLGVTNPPEELNWITADGHYGWPNCWGDFQGTDCDGTNRAIGFFAPRASANSIDFYTGDAFPAGYRFSAFVTLFGSFETAVQTGVLQVVIQQSGDSYTTQMNWFALWPNARPLGLTEGPDGALYVGDYFLDAIYRISYNN